MPAPPARPLRRAIQRDIEDVISEKILFGELTAGQLIMVDAPGDVEGESAEVRTAIGADAPEDRPFTFTGTQREIAPSELEQQAGAPLDEKVSSAQDVRITDPRVRAPGEGA